MDPAAWEHSKLGVLGITRGRGYHTQARDTRFFAFPLITDTSSSTAVSKAMAPCGDNNNDLWCLSEKDASDGVELRNIYARDSSRFLSKEGRHDTPQECPRVAWSSKRRAGPQGKRSVWDNAAARRWHGIPPRAKKNSLIGWRRSRTRI